MTSKFDIKAQEYRARAEDASVAARSSLLDRMREQHETAALRWLALGEADAVRAPTKRARRAPPPARPLAGLGGSDLEGAA